MMIVVFIWMEPTYFIFFTFSLIGLEYKTKDGLSLQVCLDNSDLINTANISIRSLPEKIILT